MRPTNDPLLLTPHERLIEVAGILAAGVLRLRNRVEIPGDATVPKFSPDPPETCLEVPEETVLSVHSG
jgi:hypothetical protein